MGSAAFMIALLLLAGTIDPSRAWLIALVVITGIAAFGIRSLDLTRMRPHLDLRLAAFVLSVLLLAGAVDANKDWLIALSIVTGMAAFMPGLLSLDGGRHDRWFGRSHWDMGHRRSRRHRRWESAAWGDADEAERWR